MKLPLTYAFLALIATGVNIGTQDLVNGLYSGPYGVIGSMLLGTGVGLVVKYVLDKRYIFAFQARDIAHDTRTFGLYTLMGLLTTAIFWGMELGFDHLFGTEHMRYLGGVIGLAIGYVAKYYLDKRFVFLQPA
ncbi:GtrA family protein [Massilia sp.]|uniref:GtrA family protein n=1 Tax=Massilia sp. TaxID=1882437 RepID=UPI00289DF4B8|nr:GtrA family protein [Massilia sp.]